MFCCVSANVRSNWVWLDQRTLDAPSWVNVYKAGPCNNQITGLNIFSVLTINRDCFVIQFINMKLLTNRSLWFKPINHFLCGHVNGTKLRWIPSTSKIVSTKVNRNKSSDGEIAERFWFTTETCSRKVSGQNKNSNRIPCWLLIVHLVRRRVPLAICGRLARAPRKVRSQSGIK